MMSQTVAEAREMAVMLRWWLSLLRALPKLSLARLEYLTGVSGRAWRNALLSVGVGVTAMVVTVLVLRPGPVLPGGSWLRR